MFHTVSPFYPLPKTAAAVLAVFAAKFLINCVGHFSANADASP